MTIDNDHPDPHRIDHGMILLVDEPGDAVVLPGVEELHFDVTTTVIIAIITIATRIVHRVEVMIHATRRVVGIAIWNPTTTTSMMTTRIKFA